MRGVREFMKKSVYCILLTFCLLTSILIGCSSNEVDTLKAEVERLSSENASLKSENEKLKQNDQYYYSNAIEKLNAAEKSKDEGDYNSAYDLFQQLIDKFPNSPYVENAKKQQEIISTILSNLKNIREGLEAIDTAIKDQNYAIAEEKLQSLKGKISDDEYNEINTKIYEAKNKPIEVTIRTLQANAVDYIGKRVEVKNLKVRDNNLSRKAFRTYSSTGSKSFEYDTDASIEVFYDRMNDVDTWVNLSSDDAPIINVIGTFNVYSNDWTQGYISAEKITITTKSTK